MKILAVVAYAGSEKLVKMAEAMLRSFGECVKAANADVFTVAVNNAAARPVARGLYNWQAHNETNEGFGNAINLAIRRELVDTPKVEKDPGFTHVLVLNSDLQFPDVHWLAQLMKEDAPGLVLSPCTDITATKEAIAEGPRDLPPTRCRQVSAYCWLVPVPIIRKLRKKFGVYLFHPDFTNYGSDDVAGLMLRAISGALPFKVVPRSFVKHLKGQTANELGVKPGDPAVLQRISNFKRAHRLT